jgi:hypothetical protein
MDGYADLESDLEPDTNELETEEEVTSRPSAAEVAQEVVAGQWGRGNKRVQKLIDAGYDPKEIDNEIKKIFNR